MNREVTTPTGSVLEKVLTATAAIETGAFYKSTRSKQPAKRPALDPTIARIAVELTCPENHADDAAVESLLNSLREMASLSCAFVAMFDERRVRIEKIIAASMAVKNCKPDTLTGAMQPCTTEMLVRLAKHQLLDVKDYNSIGPDWDLFSSQVASLNLSSVLVGGINVMGNVQGLMIFGSLLRRSDWDVETRLAMKLMSASYAAGFERHQLLANQK
jgi:hypothetical protein